jgi:hypothetical protein
VGQNTAGQYGGQDSHGGGYIHGGLIKRQRDNMDNQSRYNANSPRMMNRPPAPSRDQYQGIYKYIFIHL